MKDRAVWEWAVQAVDRSLYRLLNSPLAPPLALVAALVAAVGYFTTTSHFFYDDYIHFGYAQREGLSLSYLARDVMGHFAPAHRLFDWLIQAFFPVEFWPAQVFLLACFAGSALLVYLLLIEMFGTGPGPLLLTLLYGTSLVHVEVAQWWSAALHSLPAGLLTLLALYTYVRYHRTGSRRLLALSVAALAVGLLFYIKTLLVPLYLVLLRLLLLEPERPMREALTDVAREWRTWLLYLAPISLYLAIFLTQYWKPTSFPALWAIAQYLQTAWARAFAPNFFGVYVKGSTGHEVTVSLVYLVIVALVIISVGRRQAAWRGWVFFGLTFVVSALISGLPRIDLFGPDVAYGARYYVEPTFLFAIALGAAFLPQQAQEASHEQGRFVSPRWPAYFSWALVVAVGFHLALAWSGAHQVMEESPGPRARPYMQNVKASLQRLERAGIEPSLVDDALPEYVMEDWLVWGAPHLYNRYSWVFPVVDPDLVFDRLTQPLYEVSKDGTLVPVAFAPESGGPVGDLLARGVLTVTDGAVEHHDGIICIDSGHTSSLVELNPDPPLDGNHWYLALHYASGTRRTMPLFVDRGQGYPWLDRAVTLEGGTGAVLADLGGPRVKRVRFDLPPEGHACLDQLHVGRLIPRG